MLKQLRRYKTGPISPAHHNYSLNLQDLPLACTP
uniref:Uncharacterized protein n=1 Tax=Xenopus tropicalis TaxID=8364 RepID=A0A6I8QFM0_XENTR